MEHAERERLVTDLVAHKTPDELARALVELREVNDQMLFDSNRIAESNKASAAVVLPPGPVVPDPDDVPHDGLGDDLGAEPVPVGQNDVLSD